MKIQKLIVWSASFMIAIISGNLYGMTVTSASYSYGDNIPAANEGNLYGHSGSNLSPQLSVSDVPAGTTSFALVMDDPDAGGFVHWLMYWNNANITSMGENSIPAGAVQGMNTAGQTSYLGPCPPSDHRYTLRIYALSSALSLPVGFTLGQLNSAMAAYVLDSNILLGYFPSGGVASCAYTLSSTSVSYNASGHAGSVAFTTVPGSCGWVTTNNAPFWVTILAGNSGTGNGTVRYSVAPNSDTARTGTIAVAGKTFTVTQRAAPPTSISLTSGWNFISLPRQPANTAISEVLKDVSANLHIVWSYDNESKQWSSYKKGLPSTLTTMEPGKGYWVYMDASGTITMTGWNLLPSTKVNLFEGWNLIGYAGENNQDITTALDSISSNWSAVWNWTGGKWYAKVISMPVLTDAIGQLTVLNPGRAYWIKIRPGMAPDWTQ
jgi:Raf kinase inhibitor-like YbhB/YbcL family protein